MSADITEVRVTFGNGIKREEYGPTKRAEVTITAAVAQGDDGQAALDEISLIALRKTRELLSISGQAIDTGLPPVQPTPSVVHEQLAASVAETAAEPQRRTRRTKAQIEADNAAAEAAKANPSGNTPPADEWGSVASTQSDAPSAEAPTEASAPESPVGQPAAASPSDEWSEAGATQPTLTDADLNKLCGEHAARVGDPAKVKTAIQSFKPADWKGPAEGGKLFGISNIPAEQRHLFKSALEALTK